MRYNNLFKNDVDINNNNINPNFNQNFLNNNNDHHNNNHHNNNHHNNHQHNNNHNKKKVRIFLKDESREIIMQKKINRNIGYNNENNEDDYNIKKKCF